MGTKIEWTEKTVNTITGCTQISEGCQNCYAKRMHKRLTAMGQEKYKLPFGVIKCHNPITELSKNISKNTKLVFVNSMSDTFHKEVPDKYIYSLLQAIGMYGNKVKFQLLTKRAERLPDFEYPDNVWLGVTVENTQHKDRIEYLKQTDAKVKFLSCEPLLGDLGELDLTGIDWVIVGGESGPNARGCKAEWVRNILIQCKKQGVPFFFKQWGEWVSGPQIDYELIKDKYKKNFHKIGENYCLLNVEYKTDYGYKLGKKYTGCKLDGLEYKQYPRGFYGA